MLEVQVGRKKGKVQEGEESSAGIVTEDGREILLRGEKVENWLEEPSR